MAQFNSQSYFSIGHCWSRKNSWRRTPRIVSDVVDIDVDVVGVVDVVDVDVDISIVPWRGKNARESNWDLSNDFATIIINNIRFNNIEKNNCTFGNRAIYWFNA